MAAKLPSCISTGLSQRRCYNMENAECTYELPNGEALEIKNDPNSKSAGFTLEHDEAQIYSTSTPSVQSDEENRREDMDFDTMFDGEQSNVERIGSSTDLNQADFRKLQVGKHILQLPVLYSSSQNCRVDKDVNNSSKKEHKQKGSKVTTHRT